MIRRSLLSLLGLLSFLAQPAAAAEYVLGVAEDTAPYSFVPSLARYNNETLYSFVTQDENELFHSFETYLRFPDLAGVLPPEEVVVSAELLFYYAFDFTGFGDTSELPGDIYCHEVVEAWDQTTLTWTNRPALDPAPVDASLGILAFGLQVCDVTTAVLAWTRELREDNGLALVSPTPRVIGMHSSEAAVAAFLKPTLVIDTTVATPVPAVPPATLTLLASLFLLAGAFALRRRVE